MNEEPKEELEVDPFIEVEFKEFSSTKGCEHFFIESPLQDKNSELVSVECINCPHGVSIDPTKFEIKEGKICSKQSKK
jgi:hypothetical protein